jgi:hypothetical protein
MRGMGLAPQVLTAKQAAPAKQVTKSVTTAAAAKPVPVKAASSKTAKLPATHAVTPAESSTSVVSAETALGPVDESPAPPPAPSVVIGEAPRVKSVVDDRRLGFGGAAPTAAR